MLRSVGRGVLRALGLHGAYTLMARGALRDDGWFRSCKEGRSVDAQGQPIPWLSYPAIEFLQSRVHPDMSVFEYGCGASTHWWAARVCELVSVEHDQDWHDAVAPGLPAHATLLHVKLEYGGEYAWTSARWPGRFDIVVIDGRDRVTCVGAALVALKPDGVIVFDNSDREDYRYGYARLAEAGFRKVPFVGIAPMFSEKTETGVFYRTVNCLGL